MRYVLSLFTAACVLCVLSACGDGTTATSAPAATTAPATGVLTATAPAVGIPATVNALVTSAPITAPQITIVLPSTAEAGGATLPAIEAAKADMVKRGVAAASVSLDSVLPKQWPDSSLGCPAADQMYSQIVTPGYQVILFADNKKYTYHTNNTNTVVLCGADGKPVK